MYGKHTDKGRSDYGTKGKTKVDRQDEKGSKGIPPGMPTSSEPKPTKSVVDQSTTGDKGVGPSPK